jgi:hypothetical protein
LRDKGFPILPQTGSKTAQLSPQLSIKKEAQKASFFSLNLFGGGVRSAALVEVYMPSEMYLK